MTTRFHRAPHQVARYAPVLRLLRSMGPQTSVLEVGSGVEGVGTWWRHTFVGVDLEFPAAPVRRLRAIRADATRLPFGGDTFDVVLVIAILPWLVGSRDVALKEAARVSRRIVFVSNPCGEAAAESDRRMIDWCHRRGIQPPAWFLSQHRTGLPTEREIRTALEPYGRVTEGSSISARWQERLFRAERRLGRIPGAMSGLQPVLRMWGKAGARELAGDGPAYECWFRLDKSAMVSPPRRDS